MDQSVTAAALAKMLTKYGGAMLVGWSLLGHLDTALVKHLDSTFATKEDIQRIEVKVDALLAHQPVRKP